MWTINFYNGKVQASITAWPVGIYADFLRLTQLMQAHGADLRLPHSRALGKGLFELRCKGVEGIGRAFYCTRWWGAKSSSCMSSSRKRPKPRKMTCALPVND